MGVVRVVLVGAGRAGTIHFHNLVRSPRVQLAGVVESDPQRADQLCRHHPGIKVVPSSGLADILPHVDAVVICTPTYTHDELVTQCLQSGKAVFCEKPIAGDIEGTKKCYDTAAQHGCPLMCSMNRRFDPSMQTICDRVKAGDVGDVHIIKMCSRDHPLPPVEYLKISGGIFHDCAVHDIDMVCWILGALPHTVYAQAWAHDAQIRSMGDVDTVLISMQFPGGILASIDLSRHSSYGYDQRIEVFGMTGMLVSGNQRAENVESYSSTGCQLGVIKHSFPQRYADSYTAALSHFLDVVEGKEKEISISKQDVIDVCQIATACDESYHTGQPIRPAYLHNSGMIKLDQKHV